MSALVRFMSTATAILDEQDRKATRKDQPPFFVRTAWLFGELEDLATHDEAEIFKEINIARHQGRMFVIACLLNDVDKTTEQRASDRIRHERRMLVTWIREQIARETRA